MNKCKYCGATLKNPRAKFCSPAHKMKFRRENEAGVTDKPAISVTDKETPEQHLSRINKELKKKGLPTMMLGKDIPKIEFVSSGIKEIDSLIKGFPRKRITEIFGMKSVGKTQLMLRILEALPDLKILYIDTEESLVSPPDNVKVVFEDCLETVAGIVEESLLKDFDLIVVDSIASMVPRAEIEGEVGETHMGLKARLMSQWMRRMPHYLRNSTTALVFINQQRETMSQWGPKKFTPGGLALGYAASLRLELKSNKADKREKYQIVKVIVEKSRFSRPYIETEFKLYY